MCVDTDAHKCTNWGRKRFQTREMGSRVQKRRRGEGSGELGGPRGQKPTLMLMRGPERRAHDQEEEEEEEEEDIGARRSRSTKAL